MVWSVQLDGWLFDEDRFVQFKTREGSISIDALGRVAAELAKNKPQEGTFDGMLFVASDGVEFRFFHSMEKDWQCRKLLGDFIHIEGTIDRWGRLTIKTCKAEDSQ